MRHYLCAWVGLFLAASVCAEDPDALRDLGIKKLKESQTHQPAIVDAARFFAQAAAIHEKAGREDAATELNSYLYWCKKKMTSKDMDAFLAADGAAHAKLENIEKTTPPPDEGKQWLDRAIRFAEANPSEHLLVAIRFFEVADRFKGSETSLAAQDLSLKAMQMASAGGTASRQVELKKKVNVPVGRVPAPDPKLLADTEKTVKEVYKAQFAGPKNTLAETLLKGAEESREDPNAYFVILREARLAAQAAGLPTAALTASDRLSARFELDPLADSVQTLAAVNSASKEAAAQLVPLCVNAAESCLRAERLELLQDLVRTLGVAGSRAGSSEISKEARDAVSRFTTAQREWPNVQKAIEKLSVEPENAASNLTLGQFRCFILEDWPSGLPALAKGSDEGLKKAALAELDAAGNASGLLAAADIWYGLAQKEQPPRKASLSRHAAIVYSAALPGLSGLNKSLAEKRIAELNPQTPVGQGLDLRTSPVGAWDFQNEQNNPLFRTQIVFFPDGTITRMEMEQGRWTKEANGEIVVEFRSTYGDQIQLRMRLLDNGNRMGGALHRNGNSDGSRHARRTFPTLPQARPRNPVIGLWETRATKKNNDIVTSRCALFDDGMVRYFSGSSKTGTWTAEGQKIVIRCDGMKWDLNIAPNGTEWSGTTGDGETLEGKRVMPR